jgi:hypothetical protein
MLRKKLWCRNSIFGFQDLVQNKDTTFEVLGFSKGCVFLYQRKKIIQYLLLPENQARHLLNRIARPPGNPIAFITKHSPFKVESASSKVI